MPAATDDHEGFTKGFHHDPLQVINRGPEFFREKTTGNQRKTERNATEALAENKSRYAQNPRQHKIGYLHRQFDVQDDKNNVLRSTSPNTSNLKNSDILKQFDSARNISKSESPSLKIDTQHSGYSSSSEEKPKISVRERVQLWNKETGSCNVQNETRPKTRKSSPKITPKPSKFSPPTQRGFCSRPNDIQNTPHSLSKSEQFSGRFQPALSRELSSEEIIEASSQALSQASQRLKELQENSPKNAWLKQTHNHYMHTRSSSSNSSSHEVQFNSANKSYKVYDSMRKGKIKVNQSDLCITTNSICKQKIIGIESKIRETEKVDGNNTENKSSSVNKKWVRAGNSIAEEKKGGQRRNTRNQVLKEDESNRVSVKRMVSFIRKGGFEKSQGSDISVVAIDLDEKIPMREEGVVHSRANVTKSPENDFQPDRNNSMSLDSGNGTLMSHRSHHILRGTFQKVNSEETDSIDTKIDASSCKALDEGTIGTTNVLSLNQSLEKPVILPRTYKSVKNFYSEDFCRRTKPEEQRGKGVDASESVKNDLPASEEEAGENQINETIKVTASANIIEARNLPVVKPKPLKPEVSAQNYLSSDRRTFNGIVAMRTKQSIEIKGESKGVDDAKANKDIGDKRVDKADGVVFAKKVYISGANVEDKSCNRKIVSEENRALHRAFPCQTHPVENAIGFSEGSSSKRTTPSKKETYNCLTTVGVRACKEKGEVDNLNSSFSVSVEVEIDTDEEDYENFKSRDPVKDIDLVDGVIQQKGLSDMTVNQAPVPLKHSDSGKINLKSVSQRNNEDELGKSPKAAQSLVKEKIAKPTGVRNHRRAGHHRFPSKSSVTSTLSLSCRKSSEGSVNATDKKQLSGRPKRGLKEAEDANQQYQKKPSTPRECVPSGHHHRHLSKSSSSRRSRSVPPNDIMVRDPSRGAKGQLISSHKKSESEVSHSSSRSSRSELNMFFDTMGLDHEVLLKIMKPVQYEDDVFHDMHVWQVGSSGGSGHSDGVSEGSKVSEDGIKNIKKLTKLPEQSTSIVTKNARVIKWLCQCKKARLQSV